MLGAYITGFRRFVAIRDLAASGAGKEAMILVRSLLSLVARASWVNEPSDVAERRQRFRSFDRRRLEDEIRISDEQREAGMPIDDVGRDEAQERLDKYRADRVTAMPSDRDLLLGLNLRLYYAHVYVPASGHVHFGLGEAVDGLVGAEVVALDQPYWEIANEALRLGIFVFGLLLEESETTVEHGLVERALEISHTLLAPGA